MLFRSTIFTEVWHGFPAIADAEVLLARWTRLREIRAEVLRELETVRTSGAIGSSLAAEVEIAASGDDLRLLESLGDDLRFIMITSQARVRASDSQAGPAGIRVTPSRHAKCERCWHWRSDVGSDASRPGLCGRCVANLFGAGEPRRVA